ncbi:UNVERIFIED_CONTAM: hypothetical protein Sradi_5712700 [Sesamum radiatum]|uniref:Uncharacterized protein n=1 Tax=Sesamum radiatum TaxID=300843 RepID=A0AAW2L3H1_SESRA
MVELREQVTKETMPTERGIPFSEDIMVEELPAHFRALLHLLLAYDGTTDPVEDICKPENTTLLHKYTDGKRLSRPGNTYNLRKFYS